MQQLKKIGIITKRASSFIRFRGKDYDRQLSFLPILDEDERSPKAQMLTPRPLNKRDQRSLLSAYFPGKPETTEGTMTITIAKKYYPGETEQRSVTMRFCPLPLSRLE
jgi:hypothetical protein